MSFPRVLLIYNEPVLPKTHPDAGSEHDIFETAAEIEKILREAGFPVEKVGFNFDPRILFDAIQKTKADVVFNLFEGIATQTGTEISVAAMLEWLNIPLTGSPSFAIALGRDKVRTKYLLQGANLPTAPFITVDQTPCPIWPHRWPAIVKPACQDSSIGIEQGSVVTTQVELEKRIHQVLDRYGGPVLVEEFIFGREFHVNFIEDAGDSPLNPILTMVPIAEIRFDQKGKNKLWPIYSYDAKWNVETEEFLRTPLDSPVVLDTTLTDRIKYLGSETFRLIGLRDYGRLDVRLNDHGEPYILEVNPNPYIISEALIDGVQALGRKYSQFVVDMVWNTLARAGKSSSTPSDSRHEIQI
jgi:D-alanine-D-alanine ligase